jgi:putative transposase
MKQTYKYRATLSEEVASEARRHIDICRQVYNHALGLYTAASDGEKPSYTTLQNKLPAWKRTWNVWTTVNAKCLQMAIRRIYSSLKALKTLKEKGYKVGRLKWKAPREYRSIVFNQSGFDVDSNTGRTNHARLSLSKLGTMDLDYYQKLPEDGTIKQVILKEEKSGTWHASIVIEHDPDYPAKPSIETITPEKTVGIDLGILTFSHDSDGTAVTPLDETRDRERIEKRHRALSRKQYDSNNWEQARRKLAAAYERLSNKRKDFREKLAASYTTEYDAVFLEDLDVRGVLEQDRNGRNIAAMSWRKTIQTFKRHGKKNGCHVLTVPPEGTTKRCAKCGIETAKSLWVREHSCPACHFEADRDRNAAFEVQKLGLDELGIDYTVGELLGLGESEGTCSKIEDFWHPENARVFDGPAETALPTETTVVSAKRVVETGSHEASNPW